MEQKKRIYVNNEQVELALAIALERIRVRWTSMASQPYCTRWL